MHDLPEAMRVSGVDDLHYLREVISVDIRYFDGVEVQIHIRCPDLADAPEVRLKMNGVRQLELAHLTPRMWLTEMEIEDLREDQLEGISFRVFTRHERTLDCACRSLVIERVC